MGTRCPGRTLSRSTLAAARVPRLPLPAEGTRAGGRRRRQSDTEGAVTSQGQLAAARRSPAAGTGCGDMTGDMRALLCLWLVAQVAQVALSSRVRTRRELSPGLYQHGVYDAGGSYCQRGDVCCHGRDDGCTVPYHDTLCYCDLFCNRTVSDCCPDFWEYCLGIPAPFPKAAGCSRAGRNYPTGATYRENCNLCTCGPGGQWQCEDHACLMDGELIDAVNRGNFGWRAANYSQFWGMTLEDGIRHRLGTFRPSPTVMNMNEMHMNMDTNEVLPRHFDAAAKWPGMIHEPLDQGNCAGSWAFSTAGGHWGLPGHGGQVVTDECYPFTSQQSQPAAPPCMMHSRSTGRGKRQATARCPNPQTHSNEIYQSTPAYRLSSSEKEIMKELLENGPVQGKELAGAPLCAPQKVGGTKWRGKTALSPGWASCRGGQNPLNCSLCVPGQRCPSARHAARPSGGWKFGVGMGMGAGFGMRMQPGGPSPPPSLSLRRVVTDECYPFTSQQSQPAAPPCMMHSRSTGRGKRQATARCPNPQTHSNEIYQSTPAYRLSSSEKEIMKELLENGPVQAILEVHEDFFMYKSGIYRHTRVAEGKGPKHQRHGTHSVKITGWGEEQLPDGQTQKYWVSVRGLYF
ncbi:PREDICTED: tubulointerstitial nephritis antigen-like [Ficedula albicollis]|uniref:tubulointerstitial nephritis antigen-like n=1 Tax=Ficedula albicollis TaxID=59894 RepID=UPI0007AD8514|nr:PREDICTED: tubulointerstitial nephritis antigen-like [Ficedula albicollis]